MKATGILKLLNVFTLVITAHISVSAQSNLFKPNVKKDSAWIAEGMTKPGITFTETDDNNNKTTVTHPWIKGKVIYSPDGSLKVRQLIADPENLNTIIQYSSHNKIVEQQVNYTDLAKYTLNEVYRLPDKTPAYLFLLSKKTVNFNDYSIDWQKDFDNLSVQPADTDFIKLNYLGQVAVVLRLQNDSLKEIPFPVDTTSSSDSDTENSDNEVAADNTDSTDTIADTTHLDTNSFGYNSYIKPGKSPRPYLKYDTLKHELNYLQTYNEYDESVSPEPCISISSGTYKYVDTAFVLARDTSYYYPSLDQLDTVIARKNYRAGRFVIRTEVTHGYEQGYGGYFYETLTTYYTIGKQQLRTFNDDDSSEPRNTITGSKPNYRLQKNGALIMLLEDDTNGHGPGACGSGSHWDSYFWLVDSKSSKQLFSFSASTCTSLVNYTYTKNGKEIAQNFYLYHPTTDYDINYEFYSYWKDSSTYVFEVSDSQKLLLRNFYLHFNASNKRNPITLTAGKLQHKKSVSPN